MICNLSSGPEAQAGFEDIWKKRHEITEPLVKQMLKQLIIMILKTERVIRIVQEMER